MKMENSMEIEENKIRSAYIHIPFCKKICSYCDFCKNYYNENVVKLYLEALKKEIKENYKNELLNTLYIGGGTPSCLSYNELDVLFEITKLFKLSDDCEFTFECNYEDITDELLSLLKKNRVNRLSIGLQTFNDKYEKILNKKIDKNLMIKNVSLCKGYFDNINVDLIYALPDEKMDDLEKDLNEIIKLNVNHISTYALMIEKHTILYVNNFKELNDDVQSKMYYKIVNKLKSNGYDHYEISNFSKKGYESKHNLNYWKNEEYYGFGAGASGFVNKIRYDNTKSAYNYINGKRMIYKEKITKNTEINDYVMLSLRMINGIDKRLFKRKYNKSIEDVFDYKKLINDKLLIETESNLFIPSDKLFVSNEIIIRLLDSYILNK